MVQIFSVEAPPWARSISVARTVLSVPVPIEGSYGSLAGKNGADLFGRSNSLTDVIVIIMMIIIRIISR
jgi:hypothetical protein